MPDRPPSGRPRGWFSIGVHRPKTMENVGMLWRHARLYDAAWIFTVGHRYRRVQTDVPNTPRHMPLFHHDSLFDLAGHVPANAQLVMVELADRAVPLPDFHHPERAVYLLGAEDEGLPVELLDGKWPVGVDPDGVGAVDERGGRGDAGDVRPARQAPRPAGASRTRTAGSRGPPGACRPGHGDPAAHRHDLTGSTHPHGVRVYASRSCRGTPSATTKAAQPTSP